MASDVVHTSDDSGVGARTVVAKDLDGVEVGLLGDTVGGGADGSCDVGAVTLAIAVAATSKVLQEGGAAIEVLLALEPSHSGIWGKLTGCSTSIPVSMT